MNKLYGLILIIFLLIFGCKKDETENNDSMEIFTYQLGTKWTYVDSKSDTSYWEFIDNKTIDGTDCSELITFSTLDTNIYYYYQLNDEIYLYAQIVPKTMVDINNLTDTDSLIVLSSPSLEFVYNKQTNFSWKRKVLILQLTNLLETEWVEKEVLMEVIGRETIITPAGTFDCQKIKDENDKYYYVSDKGLIRLTQQVTINDTIINYENRLIKID